MKSTTALLLVAATAVSSSASPTLVKRAAPRGIDISHYQPTVNFNTVKASAVHCVMCCLTEELDVSEDLFVCQRTWFHPVFPVGQWDV